MLVKELQQTKVPLELMNIRIHSDSKQSPNSVCQPAAE
jgi:hypothetical protein